MTNFADDVPPEGEPAEEPSGMDNQLDASEDVSSPPGELGESESGSDRPEPAGDEAGSSEDTTVQDPADGSSAEEADAGDEGLPDWEPLTPELVEDEAIRGDFMLRWAVILLAFLLGCREITESTSLVRIKTGQYLASHGWLPPSNDVFSYTATDRQWDNLSWLLDLALAGVFTLGPAALSLAIALVAAVTFYLIVHISKPDVPTWWGSVCAALALLVCCPQFTAGPELITLLGIVLTLWFLNRWEESDEPKSLWCLVPLFFVWSNLDHRMFLGLAVLLLYALGETIGAFLGRAEQAGRVRHKQLWLVLAACLVAALLNPSGWKSLAAPFTLYAVEYPTLRSYYPITDTVKASTEHLQNSPMTMAAFWKWPTHQALIGVLVLIMTATCLVLNRSRLVLGHLFVFVGFVLFALIASHELAPAAAVAAVLGALNAQVWYRHKFRQSYSIDTGELLFSRGGRAVTVLGLFAVAFLGISGRLMERDGKRIGLGFDETLQVDMDGYRDELADSFDARPFNFRLRQGDLLIWIGQQPFVDSRVSLFAGRGEDDLLGQHNRIRHALRPKTSADPLSGNPELWKTAFDRFRVTQVIPRMYGTVADYTTYSGLRMSEHWALTRLGGATAVFARTDTNDPKLKEYIDKHQVDVSRDAFKVEVPAHAPRPGWPQAPTFYQKYLMLPKHAESNAVREARHCESQLWDGPDSSSVLTVAERVALAYRAIRKANEALSQSTEHAGAFRVLGRAYSFLAEFEMQSLDAAADPQIGLLRFYQTVSAYGQSLIVEPDNPSTHLALYRVYENANRADLALRSLTRYEELTADYDVPTPQAKEYRRRSIQRQQQLTVAVEEIERAVDQAVEKKTNRLQIAQEAYGAGYVLQALKVLEDDRLFLEQNPAARVLIAILLLESGRPEEAARFLERCEDPTGRLQWREPTAWASLASGDYRGAVQLWSAEIKTSQDARLTGLLATLPFVRSPLVPIGQMRDFWPIPQTLAMTDVLYRLPSHTSVLMWHIAIAHLEAGRVGAATVVFKKLLDTDPETPLRPLIRFYLYQMTDEWIDVVPPSDQIPVTPDLFAPDES